MSEWMYEHWFVGFLLIYTAMELSFKIINRVLRTIKVLARGWPTAPIDADGDVVYPEPAEHGGKGVEG